MTPDVRVGPLTEGEPFPVAVRPVSGETRLDHWISGNRAWTYGALSEYGAVLFRGFPVASVEDFRLAAQAVHPALVEYSEPSTPRGQYQDRVYVSSEYPSDYEIPMHGELSYTYAWPMKALFYCRTPAAVGGETPICDARQVLCDLDPELVRKFRSKQIAYVRNYHDGFLVPWQQAFKSQDRADVARFCAAHQPMTCEWIDGERLRTRQIRPAIARHPVTGDEVWFNQAHVFHAYSLGADVYGGLLEIFGPDELPVHATYGDGSQIAIEELNCVYAAYSRHKRSFAWAEGDVLLVDNMLISHGRNPFQGEREIVVCFVEPCPRFEARCGVAVAAVG
jgi:alpha-ketoglutarate-dependent taurine dioxygenase